MGAAARLRNRPGQITVGLPVPFPKHGGCTCCKLAFRRRPGGVGLNRFIYWNRSLSGGRGGEKKFLGGHFAKITLK